MTVVADAEMKFRTLIESRDIVLLVRVLCLSQIALVRTLISGARCKFPSDWKGQYFQSGLGTVSIRESLITTKGSCVDQNRDYFLIDNRESQCYLCLLMISRHTNIIQYKESFCLMPDTLSKLCAQIHVETPLYTMVREPAIPVACPFDDAYYFNYNDHQSGLCGQPISYAKPCVGHTKYLLHFKHCIDSAIWNGKDIDFECLATWKDGSESYLYSRLKSPSVNAKDDQYRCLKYLSYGSEVYMSMSADATCRGLRSPSDGPFVFTLIRDEFGWPSPACQFPDWLKGITWRDLDGRRVYKIDEKGSVVLEYFRKKPSAKRQLQSESRCTSLLETDGQLEDEVTAYSSTTHGCISKQQCLKFIERAENVVELHQGIAIDHQPEAECQFKFNEKPGLILIPEYETVRECPSTFTISGYTTKTGCAYRLQSACANETTSGSEACDRDGHLECLYIWKDKSKTYLATRLQPNPLLTNLELCMSKVGETLKKDKNGRQLTIDNSLLSLVFLRLGNTDIFMNETDAMIKSTSSRLPTLVTPGNHRKLTTTTMMMMMTTTTTTTTTKYDLQSPGGGSTSSDPANRTSHGLDSHNSISSSSLWRRNQVPTSRTLYQGEFITEEEAEEQREEEEEVDDGEEEQEEEEDEGSGRKTPGWDAEGGGSTSDYGRTSSLPMGGIKQQNKSRLTSIYDGDKHSHSQTDTDFQFALIYNDNKHNNNNNDDDDNENNNKHNNDVTRQQQQQQRKQQQHKNVASGSHGNEVGRRQPTQSPYRPVSDPLLPAVHASSQPRSSSPNCCSSLSRLSLIAWTVRSLSIYIHLLLFRF